MVLRCCLCKSEFYKKSSFRIVTLQKSGEIHQRKKWTPWTFCPRDFARLDCLGHVLLHGKIQHSVNHFVWIKSLGFWGEQQNIAYRRWSNRATYLVDVSESVRCDVTMWTSSCWWSMSCCFKYNSNSCDVWVKAWM